MFLIFLTYKANRKGKLVLKVAAHYSSQTCAECLRTSSESRQNQSDFVCVFCEHTDNADHNGSCIIEHRGVESILGQRYECVVGGAPKTLNGRGAKKKISDRKTTPCAKPHGDRSVKIEEIKTKPVDFGSSPL